MRSLASSTTRNSLGSRRFKAFSQASFLVGLQTARCLFRSFNHLSFPPRALFIFPSLPAPSASSFRSSFPPRALFIFQSPSLPAPSSSFLPSPRPLHL
eukprot:768674-Hanusia_phi.AAC.2